MSGTRKLLIAGGLALALWGMGYGLYYAVFVEHQTLDRIGSSLAGGFTLAAGRDLPGARAALEDFAAASYVYVRQVDAHGHWIGLSMLLILFGAVFHLVNFSERVKFWLSVGLESGAIVFPLGVLLETANRGWGPKLVAILGSAILTLALLCVAVGFAIARPEGQEIERGRS
jgi:hypothetical protein